MTQPLVTTRKPRKTQHVAKGGVVQPSSQALLLNPDQWEEFILAAARQRDLPGGTRYEVVKRLGGAGDGVFFNPGCDGAKFDYGYRGTPFTIDLGFDASEAFHTYAIEWAPDEIRWFVDDRLVHRRVLWDPTPIPDLPMTLHVNTWPTQSEELAGRFVPELLPAVAAVRRIAVDANSTDA